MPDPKQWLTNAQTETQTVRLQQLQALTSTCCSSCCLSCSCCPSCPCRSCRPCNSSCTCCSSSCSSCAASAAALKAASSAATLDWTLWMFVWMSFRALCVRAISWRAAAVSWFQLGGCVWSESNGQSGSSSSRVRPQQLQQQGILPRNCRWLQ